MSDNQVIYLPIAKKVPQVDDIVFGIPIRIRPEIGIDVEMDGYDCIGTLPMEIACNFLSLVKRVGRGVKFGCKVVRVEDDYIELGLAMLERV